LPSIKAGWRPIPACLRLAYPAKVFSRTETADFHAGVPAQESHMRLSKEPHETWRVALAGRALALGLPQHEVAAMLSALDVLQSIDGEDGAAWLVASRYGLLDATDGNHEPGTGRLRCVADGASGPIPGAQRSVPPRPYRALNQRGFQVRGFIGSTNLTASSRRASSIEKS
jgi:hypothetical protein